MSDLIKHEVIPKCGSFEVRFPDGGPSRYFFWEDISGRRLRPDLVDSETALELAKRRLLKPNGIGLWVTTQMEIEMEPKRIAAVVALTAAMAAPAFAQAAPRSASTQHRLQQERMYRPARYHSAYRYEYQPPYLGNEVGVIADDVTGDNPFGAPPYPWGRYVWRRGR